jgi:hypothetical protein
MKNDSKLVNTIAVGYKYYLPVGVSIADSSSYNEKLFYNGNYYYLYIDVVSYYHKTVEEYKINKNAYYSRVLEHNGKKGYIEITKSNDEYFIKAYYNYAKIEAYVNEQNLKNSIVNIEYIITSVKINNSITKLVVGSDKLKLGEEKFTLFKPKRKEGTFLDYVEEYDKYNDDIIMDDNTIPNELGNDDEKVNNDYSDIGNQTE